MILIEGEETAWHHRTWWSEGVADLTPYEDQEKIPIGMLVRGGGGFDPYADKLKIRYRSVYMGQRGWRV